MRFQPTPTVISKGMDCITEMHWEAVGYDVESNHVCEKGASWVELAMDFEIATRAMLTGTEVTRKEI